MYRLFFAIAFFLLTSCEKNIDFKLDESSPTLVVEAEIENGKPPRVILTKSVPFFSQISPEILINSFVHDAEVYISNGSLTHRLKEYILPLAPGISISYYGIDTSSLNTAFNGELNTSYQLRIISAGKEYLANTRISGLNISIDSVYFKQAPQNPDTNKRVMFARVTDPKGLGNYLRYYTKKNNQPFFPPSNSVFSDEVIDGTTYTVQLEQGIDRNNPPEPGENFFYKSDTVTLKLCNIDKSTYTFWNTWEFAGQAIGNPFSQPNKVIGNISNGALGAFCGYAVSYKTIIVQ